MTKINSKIYPNRSRIHFDGGLNNKFERSVIEDNESPDCQNVIFDEGSVETRGGTSKLNATSVGSYACDGLYTRHDNSGSETMVAWFGGSLYDLQGDSFTTIGSAQSIYTAGERVHAAEYENYMFFCNGNNTPYKYGGSGDDFTRHGIPSPASAVTASTAATGTALTGDYRYAFTYVNSALVEGDISPISTTFAAASENILVSEIDVAPQSYGVSARNLYRTITSGATYLRVATINDNTTTTYEDAIIDDDLGVEAPSDNGEPPSFSGIVYHQARLFMIDPDNNLIWYSELANPYVVKSTNFIRIGDNTFDIPQSLAVYDNSIVVFCKDNPWIIYMPTTDPTGWTQQRVRANYGCMSPAGPFKFQNKVMFPAIENSKLVGFAAIEGQTIDPSASLLTSSAVGSEMQSDKIEPDVFNIQEGIYLDDIESIVYKNKAYITCTYGSGNIKNNRIYLFDFSLGRIKNQPYAWTPWTGLGANSFTVYDGDLYYASSDADGFVYEMNTAAYNDDGSAIDSYFWTKEYTGQPGDENYFKDYRYCQLFFELSGAWFMNFTKRIDSDSGEGDTQTVDLTPPGSVWGTMVYGTDLWGGGSDEGEERIYLSPTRGKRIQYKFSNQNTADQKFKVVGMNFVYNVKGLR